MDNETREQIALICYEPISPVLAEPGRGLNECFHTQLPNAMNFRAMAAGRSRFPPSNPGSKHTGRVTLMH